ncbi:ergothioneine biosynthesis protein EgtB [Herbaspirillum sp. RV1423]|uniref:ergothioneine biosynthesis protein EgtB n=1 Tax=Herbaspirillum sp. RV1423 TaxID=1443993 RepID=UPI0004B4AA68|nr:ergothioneine biosynthesis protein EgtB [Herbaspirillum sp. RV1423]
MRNEIALAISNAVVVDDYLRVREYSMILAAPLSEEDCCAQSMPDASPVKWHLAHTSWFFETFILEQYERGFRPFHPAFRVLFNSYYDGVGDKHPRPQRGMLTRPSLAEVRDYRADVDRRMQALLQSGDCDAACLRLLELGMQHEQQHQELILTDLKHLLSLNPLKPFYLPRALQAMPVQSELEWHAFEADVVEIGHGGGTGFCFDNELPRHRQFVEAYALGSRLISNIEYLMFVEQGGYENPAHWLSAGWEWRCANKVGHPLYWHRQADGGWQEFTLHGMLPLDPHAAVLHLSYYEADAYARWAGARLPTEAEWEHAASLLGNEGRQLFGTAWQWTSSSYAPYPGYEIPAGAVGEYNGKFMVNQYVLRGSSGATPQGHSRLSYRNFFPAATCWQYSGIRLARSL